MFSSRNVDLENIQRINRQNGPIVITCIVPRQYDVDNYLQEKHSAHKDSNHRYTHMRPPCIIDLQASRTICDLLTENRGKSKVYSRDRNGCPY